MKCAGHYASTSLKDPFRGSHFIAPAARHEFQRKRKVPVNSSSNLDRKQTVHLVAASDLSDPAINLPVQHSSDRRSHFEIYRTEHVQFTSELFGGGDWHWRLTDPFGHVLAGCGGYRNQEQCRAAVESLRREAADAILSSGVTVDGTPSH